MSKIPSNTEAEVMFRSNLACCVCQKRGHHIHHIDGDDSNHNFDNLALLCFEHHDQATVKGGLSKKLSAKAIKKFREHHYQVIESDRQKALGTFSKEITQLSEEDLLTASISAVVIVEIDKISEDYFSAGWSERSSILDRLNKFSNRPNHRIAYEIFNFLLEAAGQTRAGMTKEVSDSILYNVLEFCPSFHSKSKQEQTTEIAKQCINIGDAITYDSLVYLKDLNVAMDGCTILKFIYRAAKKHKLTDLTTAVNFTYDQLEATLNRPDRNDLGDARDLLRAFRNDLDNYDLSYPPLPEHLMKIIYPERR